ncbi:MAG: hypothetical protein CMQ40_10705 [Gammaproteobacteria bacterium]|nr:hypothetical protein [Gammaproteobacteria bacterium]
MASLLPRQSEDGFRIARAKGLFFPKGKDFGLYMGNMSALAFGAAVTPTDYPSYEDSAGAPAFSATTSTEANITWTQQNYNQLAQSLAALSDIDPDTYTQEAAIDQAITWTQRLYKDATFEIPAKLVTPKSFVIDAAGQNIQMVEDEHYVVDDQAGLGIIIKLPDAYDASTDVDLDKVFTYDQAAYEARLIEGLTNPNGIDGAIVIRDTNASGAKFARRFHNVRATPANEEAFISQDALSEVEFSGKVLQDPARLATGNGFFTYVEMPALLA